VLLAPAARGSLAEMRQSGFAGYLVKPVRQASLAERLLLCRERAATGGTPPSDRADAGTDALPDMGWGGDDVLPPLVAGPPPVAEPHAPALPEAPLPDAAAARMAATPVDAPLMDTSGLNVLLAEDNPINMMLIRELLRRRGHRVTEVANGNAAVEAMRTGRYDLLLTDIHMPGMDGIEAAQAVRAWEGETGRARTPIVALTADALDTGKRACQEAGMDGFLTKPVDPAELEEMFLMLFPSEDGSHIVAA
jgi:CheY-like chemotaxis protein